MERVQEKDLTDRQQEVLDAIIDGVEVNGYPPTVRELRDSLGVSSIRGASIHLEALERKGYIQRSSKARGIRVLRMGKGHSNRLELRIPLIGQIQAGLPMMAEQNIEKFINIKRAYLKGNRSAFALRVQGESMIDAGIRPGDIAIIIPTTNVENGDIVVALIEDSATLKKFFRLDSYVALLPANPIFEPIVGREFSIQGKLIGIIRADDEPGGSLANDACLVPVYKDHAVDQPKTVVQWVYGRAIN